MSALFRQPHQVSFGLNSEDRASVEAVAHDPFQSPRAQKRARVMLRLADGVEMEKAAAEAGMNAAMIESLMERYSTAGLRGALFGVERSISGRRYDVEAVARALRQLVVSKPTDGLYWSVKSLTEGVVQLVPDAQGISSEHVRTIMVKKLGIRSVRHIEPYWLQQLKGARAGHAA